MNVTPTFLTAQVCIQKWFSTQKRKEVPCSCPYCREPLRLSQLQTPAALAARADALPVHCPYGAAGCAVTVPRSGLAAHLAGECPYVSVRCPECRTEMPRERLAAHRGSDACPCRRLPCPYREYGCPARLQPGALAAHTSAAGAGGGAEAGSHKRCSNNSNGSSNDGGDSDGSSSNGGGSSSEGLAGGCPFEPLRCGGCGAVVLRGQAEAHRWGGCAAALPCPHRCYGGCVGRRRRVLGLRRLGNGRDGKSGI